MEKLTITQLAELCKIRPSTIKYYTELGLLPYEQKGANLTRRYPKEEAGEKIKEILKLKTEDKKSIREITEILMK